MTLKEQLKSLKNHKIMPPSNLESPIPVPHFNSWDDLMESLEPNYDIYVYEQLVDALRKEFPNGFTIG